MTALPLPDPSPEAAPGLLARLDVRTLHAGWGLGVLCVAALALLLAGEAPRARALAALLAAAAPGLLALLPGGSRRWSDLLAWGAAAALALWLGGGVAGPLGALALGPALAGLALRRPVAGVVASCLAAGAVSTLEPFGRLPPSPFAAGDAPALASSLTALLALTAVAAASAAAGRSFTLPPAPAPAPAAGPDPALEARLREAEAGRDRAEGEARARARFLAEMSHELRTPLNAVVGFSDVMRTRLFGPLPERYAEYAELIHQSGEHLTALIDDVLDLSKIDADRYELRRELLDAREPAEAALRLMRPEAERRGVALRADLPPGPLTADADARALKQIALNLLSNALKFTPAGGEVDLSLRAAAGALELAVADTGPGISPEDLKRLGAPYAQAEAGRGAKGTGLGLSLVKALAGLHGGELLLESRLGEGTAATVRLPVLAEPR